MWTIAICALIALAACCAEGLGRKLTVEAGDMGCGPSHLIVYRITWIVLRTRQRLIPVLALTCGPEISRTFGPRKLMRKRWKLGAGRF